MPENSKKIFSAFSGAFILCAAVLRLIIILFYTDAETGFVRKSAAEITAAFCICCALPILLSAVFLRKLPLRNPFYHCKSRAVFFACILAGAAMLYDFVFQCIGIYHIYINSGTAELNDMVMHCLTAASSVLCAFYFVIMGISYITDAYDFRYFKYYHVIPLCRHLFAAFMCLTRYDDGIYSMESILYYTVLIIGMIYFILFLSCLDKNHKMLRLFCFFGFSYSVLCLVLAVPQIIAFVFRKQMYNPVFSPVACCFMGVLAFFLSAAALKKDESKEG